MAKATILFADNDSDFLKTRAEFLEQEGYHIILATDSTQARRILEQAELDLAILDIRLDDDDDEKDTSGLTLAKDVARLLPKIILTNFPSVDTVRQALKPQLDGLPLAVEFVAKLDGPEALIQAVHDALGTGRKWLRQVKEAIAGTDEELKQDHNNAQRQSTAFFWASLWVAVIGITMIFLGVALVYWRGLEIGIASTIGGIVTEVVSYLFFKRADIANARMDDYHKERITGYRFETLLQACNALDAKSKQEYCKEQVIVAAIDNWLPVSNKEKIVPAKTEPKEESTE